MPVKARAALAIVESAYDLSVPGDTWLRQLVERLAAVFPGTTATYAYTATLDPRGRPIFQEAHFPIATDPVAALSAAVSPLTDAQLAAFYRPGTVRGGLDDGLGPMAELGSVDGILALQDRLGGGELVHIGGIDASGSGVHVGLFVSGPAARPLELQVQERLGVHLQSGLRLRRTLGDRSPLDQAEAVFEADGRLAHADGPAASLRHELERVVKAVDASRGRTLRSPTGESDLLDVWQGLVDGRWSLVDRVDTDGRRYYVALANPALGVPLRALTEAEAQAVAMVVAGEPNKTIAYAMGVAESTVANWIRNAMLKMGVSTRVNLIRLGRQLLANTLD